MICIKQVTECDSILSGYYYCYRQGGGLWLNYNINHYFTPDGRWRVGVPGYFATLLELLHLLSTSLPLEEARQ